MKNLAKKALLALVRDPIYRYFLLPPRKGLRLLFKFKLDIWLYSMPMWVLYNLYSLRRLYVLRLKGERPAVIFYSLETDGRFERISQLGNKDPSQKSVWFAFPIKMVAAEAIIFDSYSRRGCGFYEDARQKYKEPSNWQNRLNYRAYCHRLFRAWELFVGKVDFFLSGSNNDRHVVELITVAQERGVDWITCEREGTGTKHSYVGEGEGFRTSESIQAHYIFTANEGHRSMFECSRLPSVRSIEVLGEIDTDWWFHWDRKFSRPEYQNWHHYRKKVLFLTFGLRNYIEPALFPQYPDMNWAKLLGDCEDVIYDYALQNRDCLVFYKMGHMEDRNENFMAKVRAAGLTNVVPLDRSFPCNELILYSDVTIGFQTTAMFEAMFGDKPLFYVHWAIPEVLNPAEHLLPIENSGAVRVIRSKQQLADDLSALTRDDAEITRISSEELRKRKLTREIMFVDADGRVSERYLARIYELLELRRNGFRTEEPAPAALLARTRLTSEPRPLENEL